jgi:uncharacterized protein (UPF0548 family)
MEIPQIPGLLPHHTEDGEESFIATRLDDGSNFYEVHAVWRPAIVASKICLPATRFVQRWATRRYIVGVQDAVAAAEPVAA